MNLSVGSSLSTYRFLRVNTMLLQKAIIEEFAPRFAPDTECLYVGDTIAKDLAKNEEKLRELVLRLP